MGRSSDEDVLKYAIEQNWVLFTQGTAFLKLHAEGIQHKGIVYASQRTSIGKVIQGFMLVFQVLELQEMSSHLEFL